jgi:hypothetical protein
MCTSKRQSLGTPGGQPGGLDCLNNWEVLADAALLLAPAGFAQLVPEVFSGARHWQLIAHVIHAVDDEDATFRANSASGFCCNARCNPWAIYIIVSSIRRPDLQAFLCFYGTDIRPPIVHPLLHLAHFVLQNVSLSTRVCRQAGHASGARVRASVAE